MHTKAQFRREKSAHGSGAVIQHCFGFAGELRRRGQDPDPQGQDPDPKISLALVVA